MQRIQFDLEFGDIGHAELQVVGIIHVRALTNRNKGHTGNHFCPEATRVSGTVTFGMSQAMRGMYLINKSLRCHL